MNITDPGEAIQHTERPLDPLRPLSARQAECLRLVYQRKTSKEIAKQTGLAIGTVNSYISEAVIALSARNRRHAAEIFMALWGDASSPDKVEPEEIRVEATVPDSPPRSVREAPSQWPEWLPIRPKGAEGNDTRTFTRILQVIGLAAGGAIGFGALASGAEVISRLIRG